MSDPNAQEPENAEGGGLTSKRPDDDSPVYGADPDAPPPEGALPPEAPSAAPYEPPQGPPVFGAARSPEAVAQERQEGQWEAPQHEAWAAQAPPPQQYPQDWQYQQPYGGYPNYGQQYAPPYGAPYAPAGTGKPPAMGALLAATAAFLFMPFCQPVGLLIGVVAVALAFRAKQEAESRQAVTYEKAILGISIVATIANIVVFTINILVMLLMPNLLNQMMNP